MELLLHIYLPKVVIDTSIATVHPAASHAPCNAPYLNSSVVLWSSTVRSGFRPFGVPSSRTVSWASKGLTGPARSCRRVPPADERYIYCRSSDRCLSLLQHCAFVVPPLVSRAVFPHVDEQVVANSLSTFPGTSGGGRGSLYSIWLSLSLSS